MVQRDHGRPLAGLCNAVAGHAPDPLAAYAYRWLGGIAPQIIPLIAGSVGSGGICRGSAACSTPSCAPTFAACERLARAVSRTVETIPMGVEPAAFSRQPLRSPELRGARWLGLGLKRCLLLSVSVAFSGREALGNGSSRRRRIRSQSSARTSAGRRRFAAPEADRMLAEQYRNVAVLPRPSDRGRARSASRERRRPDPRLRSGDLLPGGGRSARQRSPADRPDRGAAVDQLRRRCRSTYRAGSERSLEPAIDRFIDRGPELQRAAAVRASRAADDGRTFRGSVRALRSLVPERVDSGRSRAASGAWRHLEPFPEMALARPS